MSKSTNITHLTSAHPRYDTRIFLKECLSLAKESDYEVNLIVSDGLGDETLHGVRIYDVGRGSGRLERLLKTTQKVFEKARSLESDLYHLHDPELIPVGLKLKKLGKKVVFDAHEDLPKQIRAKHYIPTLLKPPLSYLIGRWEAQALRQYDHVVTATPIIQKKFSDYGITATAINNFPMLDELIEIQPRFERPTICYIGLLYETRGIRELIQAVTELDVTLIIAGKFFDPHFEAEIRALKGWEKVDFRGFVDRAGVQELLKSSIAGMVTLHPTPSYVEAYPVKMFEYMGAGLAVIASDFPLYRTFVEENGAGLCVDPLDVPAITQAIATLLQEPEKARVMGERGKAAVRRHYNWQSEEQKLTALYKRLLP